MFSIPSHETRLFSVSPQGHEIWPHGSFWRVSHCSRALSCSTRGYERLGSSSVSHGSSAVSFPWWFIEEVLHRSATFFAHRSLWVRSLPGITSPASMHFRFSLLGCSQHRCPAPRSCHLGCIVSQHSQQSPSSFSIPSSTTDSRLSIFAPRFSFCSLPRS